MRWSDTRGRLLSSRAEAAGPDRAARAALEQRGRLAEDEEEELCSYTGRGATAATSSAPVGETRGSGGCRGPTPGGLPCLSFPL